MEISQIVEIGSLVAILGAGLRAFFVLQAQQKAYYLELARIIRLVEGPNGDEGFKRRISDLEKKVEIMEGINTEVHQIRKRQDVMFQILRSIADKLEIQIPFNLD